MSNFRLSLITLLAVSLAACVTISDKDSRSWLDTRTAAAITAQIEPIVLSREDFPAGVNVRDYVEIGAFDVNRPGARKQYLSFTLWSTIDRSVSQWSSTAVDYSSVTLWADDQPIQLKLSAASHTDLGISTPVFTRPSPTAHQMYYEVTLAQLSALAQAQRWTLAPGGMVEEDQKFSRWRGSTGSLSRFITIINRNVGH